MKILAIDTSTKYLSVALADNERILASFRDEGRLEHSSLLIPSIDRVLEKAGLRLKDVNAIAVSIGPGSFTGLRIGVAACKGMNLAMGIPIAAVPTLDVIAYNFAGKKNSILAPLLDAKKSKVYTAFYGPGMKRLSGYTLTDIGNFLKSVRKRTLVFGDALELYKGRLGENANIEISYGDWFPRAEVVAKIGFGMARKRKFTNPDRLVPMYLHSKYCQVNKAIRIK